jgi:glycosyltransferase involved in cell wall biosynthesis
MPKVSVVVPNYNHGRFLRQRVNSILNQTYENFELILMDDCSTDDSRTIISQYKGNSKVRIQFNDDNSGSTFKQWNKGFHLCRGELIWFAESDDYADERFLERLVPGLEAEPKAAFAYCRSWRVDENGQVHGFADEYLTDLDPNRWTRDYCSGGFEECQKYFVFRNIVPNASAVLFRKKAYEKVGCVDESFQLCGDWKLWASMALTGKIIHLGEALNYFRFHSDSVRGRDRGGGLIAHETLRVIRWMLSEVTITEEIHERLCLKLADVWVPAIVTFRTPLNVKRTILHNAREIDSQAIPRIVWPALQALWRKLQRHTSLLRAKE